jgi:phage internal scaffolding protein
MKITKDIPAAPVFIRTQYNYDHDAASNESGLECKDSSLAQQHHREECDINTIMERFGQTGQLPQTSLQPSYGDFSGVVDYHTALNAIIAAEEQFDTLPAQMRARFDNDPAKLIDFLENDNNQDEAIALGLVNPISSTANNEPAQAAEKPVTGTPE